MLVASPANSGGITKRTWNGITIMESNESLKVIKLLAWKLSKKSTSFQKNFHSSRKVSRNPLVFALLFMVIPTADHREIWWPLRLRITGMISSATILNPNFWSNQNVTSDSDFWYSSFEIRMIHCSRQFVRDPRIGNQLQVFHYSKMTIESIWVAATTRGPRDSLNCQTLFARHLSRLNY